MAAAELIQLVLLLAAAGVAAGVLAGLLGVGGGIVLVPVLDLAFGAAGVPEAVRMHLAVGTSLASIVPTALSSARAHWRRGGVDPAVALSWSPAIAAGASLGAWLASRVEGGVLSLVFAVVALAAGLRMVIGGGVSAEGRDRGAAHLRWSPLPVLIGTVSSMMGIGGGTLSVPALSALGLSVHRAVGTSAWLGLWIALPAAVGFAWLGRGSTGLPPFSLGHVNLLALAVLLPATVLAAPLGAKIAHSLTRRQLAMTFGLFLLVSALRMFYRAATG